MPDVNCSIIAIASIMSRSQVWGDGLKDNDRLPLRSFQHFGPQHRPVRQIRLDAQNIRQPVLQMDAADQGQPPGLVELRDQVHIR